MGILNDIWVNQHFIAYGDTIEYKWNDSNLKSGNVVKIVRNKTNQVIGSPIIINDLKAGEYYLVVDGNSSYWTVDYSNFLRKISEWEK